MKATHTEMKKMAGCLGGLLLLLLACPAMAQALDFTCTTNNSQITITRYTGTGGAVDIPGMINGLPVTSIGLQAFLNCASLTSVTIPSSVTNIGGATFWGCADLTGLTIPSSVTSIGSSAFHSCTSLTNMTIPDSVTQFGTSAFGGCSTLKTVTLGNGVTNIDYGMFGQCSQLTSVTLGSGVSSLGVGSGNAFYLLPGLCEINVSPLNAIYNSANGVLFNKNQTTLIQYPASKAGESYAISNTVTNIGTQSFYGCTNLTSMAIPDGVVSIGDYAFYECANLTRVAIAGTVTNIGNSAFSETPNLASIYFEGNAPSIGSQPFISHKGAADVTKVIVYYLAGKTGWGSTYGGRPTALWAPVLSTITVLPATAVVPMGNTQTFTASGADQAGLPVVITPSWSVTGGNSINTSGVFTATTVGGPFTVTASSGSTNGPAKVTVIPANNQPPTVATPASATLNQDTGAWLLSVRGFDDGGEALLTYTWSATGPAPVTYSTNGNNVAKNCAVTLTASGSYTFTVTIRDPGNLTTSSTVMVQSLDYVYTISNGKVSITGYIGNGGVVSIPGTILSLPVTSIGNSAFNGCASLTGVTIPAGVVSIGTSAFSGCTSLSNVTTPSGVTNIGQGAFSGCANLTSVTIPTSITSLAQSLFYNCTRLSNVTIPTTVTSIGSSAFNGCASLTGVTIPAGVVSIGASAFSGCTSLSNVTIPSGVTSIGQGAFYGCANLVSVTIPASVTSFATTLFGNCTRLSNVTIPTNLTNIGISAFNGCTSLIGVTIPASVISIGSGAFNGCASLTGVTIPASVTSLDMVGLFANCTSLTNVTLLPGNITTIGNDMFFNCTKLKSFAIPGGVTSIGDHAFMYCTSLTRVTIPSGVTSIGDQGFNTCTSLTGIYFEGNAPTPGNTMFDLDNNLTVYYLAGKAGWSSTYGGRPTALWSQTLTTIALAPAIATVLVGSNQTFTAKGADQFGYTMTMTAPAWSVNGGGTITTGGIFNATTAGGPFTVTATSGGTNGMSSVTVVGRPLLSIQAIRSEAGGHGIDFLTESGISYEVLWKANLITDTWHIYTNFTGNGGNAHVCFTNTTPQEFFQIQSN